MARRPRSRSTASKPSRGARAGAAGVTAGESADVRARDVALRMLARAARSASEVEAVLERRHFASDAIARTLLALRDLRYIDDEELARRRAEELLLRRGYGRLRVAHELTHRGVADSVVETAIATVLEGRRDAELARLALRRKFGQNAFTDRSARARAYRFLIGRGHPAEAVGEILGDDDSR